MNLILQWIDLVWLPITLVVVHKYQRAFAAAYILSCVLMLRLQTELLSSTGFTEGFTGLIKTTPFDRGLIVYSLFHIIYIIMAIYSPSRQRVIFMSASISIFFAALFVSMGIMVI